MFLLLALEQPSVIIFGGGSSPDSNQASIEAHVAALGRVLEGKKPEILFAAGTDARTVQVRSAIADPAGDLLSAILGDGAPSGVDYRPSSLRGSAASREALFAALERSRENSAGTIVFGAGHGLPAEDEHPAVISLWGADGDLGVDVLARVLDAGPRRAPAAFVLGQCHSGAFADLMYVAGDPKRGLAKPVRCTLAAVPGDRPASGCTADVNDPSARAYLAVIALGLADPRADLDGNGAISLSEAHAFARIEDETVDVPVSSSEAWLRKRIGETKAPKMSFDRLVARARPEEKAVLLGLKPSLRPVSISAVESALQKLDDKIEALDRELQSLEKTHDRARREARAWILSRWPDLVNPFSAAARSLLASRASEIASALEKSEVYPGFASSTQAINAKAEQIETLDLEAARLERWHRAAMNVVLEEELRKKKDRAGINGLEALLACERMTP